MVIETTIMIANAQYQVAKIELVYKTIVKSSQRQKLLHQKRATMYS